MFIDKYNTNTKFRKTNPCVMITFIVKYLFKSVTVLSMITVYDLIVFISIKHTNKIKQTKSGNKELQIFEI